MKSAFKKHKTFRLLKLLFCIAFFATHAITTSGQQKHVLGYHPSWVADSQARNYDWSLLSTLAYYGYEVEPSNISSSYTYRWQTASIIDSAKAHGVRVALVVALSGNAALTELLEDTTKCNELISDLLSKLRLRSADAINVDFEGIPKTQRDNFTRFVKSLRDSLASNYSDFELSLAGPAVDWNGSWDFPALASVVDFIVLMGYDYHWQSCEKAGAVAPLSGDYVNVRYSIGDYIASGCPRSKILLGVPWYGYDWPVESDTRNPKTIGPGRAVRYYQARQMAGLFGKAFDTITQSAVIKYQSGDTLHQLWFDDSLSLSRKYQTAADSLLGGIAIWAIGYEADCQELWKAIEVAFRPATLSEEISARNEARIFPNPARDFLRIQTCGRGIESVNVRDLLGNSLYSAVNYGKSECLIPVNEWSIGVYFLVIQYNDGIETQKVFIQ